jgi:hypothetical protein
MAIGLGQLRLSPDDFWAMSPLEFLCTQKGFFDLEQQREKQHWYRTIALLNIQLPRKDKINPDMLFQNKKRSRPMTREEFEKLEKRWRKFHVISEPQFPIPGGHGKL